jgi:hypothetical protein
MAQGLEYFKETSMRHVLQMLAVAGLFGVANGAHAAIIVGGQTNVLLDTATLSSAASLELSGVSPEVIAPGELGDASVAFGVNPRDAAPPLFPTTFAYEPSDFLGTFSGTIEHSGSVFFNDDAVEVGNFTIGFDAARAGTLGGNASGFFVASTVGIAAILFDIENPSALSATESDLNVAADLLVSPEFGEFLFTNGLSTANLAGADVGDALVSASAVPEPSALAILGVGVSTLLALRTRRRG